MPWSRLPELTSPCAARLSWMAWAALFLTVAIPLAAGSDRSVTPAYRTASLNWFASRNLYNRSGSGFLYLPQAAILFAPCAWLPSAAGEVLWRSIIIGSFAFGVFRLARLAGRDRGTEMFPLLTIFALIPAAGCARNGQSTLAMAAAAMLATAELADCRWWRAAFWLALGLAVKPLIAVLILLVGAVERKMAWRLPAAVGLVLVFPFFTQSPHYVIRQYGAFLQTLRAASHLGVVQLWAQPFSALELAGLKVPESTQTLIRFAAAIGTLASCRYAVKHHTRTRAVLELFAFSTLYILIFSPRTENNTYAMLGPVLGLFAAGTFVRGDVLASGMRRAWTDFRIASMLVVAAFLLSLFNNQLSALISPPGERIWLNPLVGTLCLVFLVVKLVIGDEKSTYSVHAPNYRSPFVPGISVEHADSCLVGTQDSDRNGSVFRRNIGGM